MRIINIYSKGKYPADALSNFAPHSFDFDGVTGIPCMEAFLQSLKFEDEAEQQKVLRLSGKEEKMPVQSMAGTELCIGRGKRSTAFLKSTWYLSSRRIMRCCKTRTFRQHWKHPKAACCCTPSARRNARTPF